MPKLADSTGRFTWSAVSEEAAQDIAAGTLTAEAIAEKAGVSIRTLFNWRSHPDFVARVDELLAEYRATVRARGLAVLERRVDALNRRWSEMQRVIAERGADPSMAGVPGGTTGLLVRTLKTVGSGPKAKVVPVYEVDTALLRELREHEKQAAQELGQWVDKQSVHAALKGYVTESPDTLWLEDDEARELACRLDERLAVVRGDGQARADQGGPETPGDEAA